MSNVLKKILRNIKFASILSVCFSGAIYIAFAETTAINVQQEVVNEGNGQSGEDGGGGFILPIDATPSRIFDVRIYDVDQTSAKVSWRTEEVCLAELSYGKTDKYEIGTLIAHADSYLDFHEIALDNLQPGVKYYLKINVTNQKAVKNIDTSYSFYTVPEFLAVPNVGSLTATQVGEAVVLDWENPQVPDFQGVQISKQTGAPAFSPDQGEKVFFGLANNFVDTDVKDDTKYYYTVFAFDTAGKFSSGVIVSIKTDFPDNIPSGTGNGGNVDKPGGTVISPGSGTQTSPVDTTPIKDVRNLKATADVVGKKITLSWEYAEIAAASEVEIRRDLNFPSMSPLEGEMVYAGSGTSFEDINVKKGQVYFYTVFVKNSVGRYSGGAMIAAELKESATESPEASQWQDMSFVDVNSGISLSIQGENEIDVLQSSILGVSYGVENLPAKLVAVAIQLGNSSYLLDYNEDESAYRTSFVVPETQGEYSFDVVFLNADNEVFFEKDLKLKVLPRGEIYTFKKDALLGGEISFARTLCRSGNLLGGENQNCMTRTAIDGAEVTIFRKNEDEIWEIWNAKEFNQENPFMTDESGRYGFYLPNGEYEIGVKRDGFEYRKIGVTVANNILAEDVRIYVKKDIKYGIILLAILIILIAIKNEKKILRYRKK